MVTEIPLKKQEQAPLSSTATIRQCLPCVQEGLSVLQSPKFSLCIGHFARFDLRHSTLPALFVLRGGGLPQAGQQTLTHFPCLPMSQSQQESISGQATWQARQVSEKAKEGTGETF